MKSDKIGSQHEVKESGLKNLFIEQLQDLYSAESQLLKVLPKMKKAAASSALKIAFSEHLETTQKHINRLDKILDELNEKPGGVKCKAMEGIVHEGKDAIEKEDEDPDIKDAGLIAAAQRVEHYEMAGYGTVRAYAQRLGFDAMAKTLNLTLQEEGRADKDLTQISYELLSNTR